MPLNPLPRSVTIVLSKAVLHWIADMVFQDDECRISIGHAPANFTTVKYIAQNIMRRSLTEVSMRLKRKVAACRDEILVSLTAQ